jgi:putative phage-type endonuclease
MRQSKLLKDRQTGIGGSDSAAILGVDPYRTILDVYYEKRGELGPKEDNKDMKRGRLLEDDIATLFSEDTGAKLIRDRSLRRHPACDYIIGHIDRRIMSMPGEEGQGIFEAKAPRSFQYPKWKEFAPDEVYVQVQHYMGVFNLNYAYACAWLGATDLKYHRVPRDNDFIALMFEREQHFWEAHVLRGIPPEGRASAGTIAQLYPTSTNREVALPNDLGTWLEVYYNSRKTRLAMEKAEEEAELHIKTEMGDASQGLFNDGEVLFGVSWKSGTPFKAWDFQALSKDDMAVQRYKTLTVSRRTFSVKKKVIGLIAGPKEDEDECL